MEKLRARTRPDYSEKICGHIAGWQNLLASGKEPPAEDVVLRTVGNELGAIVYKMLVPRLGGALEEHGTMMMGPRDRPLPASALANRSLAGIARLAPTQTPPQSPVSAQAPFDPEKTSLFSSPAPNVAAVPIAPSPKEPGILAKTVYGTLLSLALMVEAGNSNSDEAKRISAYLRKCAEDLLSV